MSAQQLIDADKAFIAYSADDPILIPRGNTMPIIGRAEIAQSQDLGYIFGRYTLRENRAVKTHVST